LKVFLFRLSVCFCFLRQSLKLMIFLPQPPKG
jgi:hypothetical protein